MGVNWICLDEKNISSAFYRGVTRKANAAYRLAAMFDPGRRFQRMKRFVRPFVVGMGLLVALAVVAGCGGSEGSVSAQGGPEVPDPLVMGLIPAEDNQEVLRDYEPLVDYMSEELGVEVEPFTATDYSGIIEAMRSDEVDVAWFGPLSYVLASDIAGAEAVAVPYEKEGEEPTYKSLILTQAGNDEIEEVEDLEGKTFSFVDPSSTSGYLYPTKMLTDAGVDPETDLAESRFAGGHDASILAIQNGDVDAGASWDGQLETMIEAGVVEEDSVKVVAESEPIPKDPIAVRGDLPEGVKKRIQEVFLEATPESVGADNLGSEGAVGYQKTSDESYDAVRKLADELKLTEDELLG